MSIRVSPIERIRAEIDDLFSSERELGDVLEEVARLGVRLLMQTAIEAEVTEFLGRERYSHGERLRTGSRNGHCPTTIKTTAGAVTIHRPKLRGTDETFAYRLLGVGVCRTNAFESLVISGFVRGLSVRDVEASLADALGAEAALSKSTVSRVCGAIKDEFDTWKARVTSRRWRSSTSSSTEATSACTTAPGPSRCSPHGALPLRDVPYSSASVPAPANPPTHGRASWTAWSPEGWGPRFWSSPMEPPA